MRHFTAAQYIVCLAGLVLLFSAWTKSNDQRTFRRDLMRYGLIPVKFIGVTVWFVTLFEWFLGAALLVAFCLSWLMPGTAFLFFFFAFLTFWGEKKRNMTDCGCFAGLLPITPRQSIIIDLFLAVSLSFCYFSIGKMDSTPLRFGHFLIILSITTGAVLLILSQKKPVFDVSRLKIGGKWKKGWLPGINLQKGEHVLVFMHQDCPHCKNWIQLLNIMHLKDEMPSVSGILSFTNKELIRFGTENFVLFPLETMKPVLFNRMVTAYPTAVRLKEGLITEKWTGRMPVEMVREIRTA